MYIKMVAKFRHQGVWTCSFSSSSSDSPQEEGWWGEEETAGGWVTDSIKIEAKLRFYCISPNRRNHNLRSSGVCVEVRRIVFVRKYLSGILSKKKYLYLYLKCHSTILFCLNLTLEPKTFLKEGVAKCTEKLDLFLRPHLAFPQCLWLQNIARWCKTHTAVTLWKCPLLSGVIR